MNAMNTLITIVRLYIAVFLLTVRDNESSLIRNRTGRQ
jgi:hypothetical protein